MNVSTVITTINPPNDCIKAFSKDGKRDVIVVGDEKTRGWDPIGCSVNYWSLNDQKSLSFSSYAVTPKNSYTRKNIGYLIAMLHGAHVIKDTDDDNMPYDCFFDEPKSTVDSLKVSAHDWINIYKFFTDERIWPRGLPLFAIDFPEEVELKDGYVYSPIQQGMIDGSPDVDAIYRLVMYDEEFRFDSTPVMSLSPGTWCPFNSQNTTWFKDAFPLMYLPTTCSMRMTDIIRSFVAQKICWVNNWRVSYHNSSVFHNRNEHDLMKDFEDELVGYRCNDSIKKALDSHPLYPGRNWLIENMYICYTDLINMEILTMNEFKTLDAWSRDIDDILG